MLKIAQYTRSAGAAIARSLRDLRTSAAVIDTRQMTSRAREHAFYVAFTACALLQSIRSYAAGTGSTDPFAQATTTTNSIITSVNGLIPAVVTLIAIVGGAMFMRGRFSGWIIWAGVGCIIIAGAGGFYQYISGGAGGTQ